MSWFRNAIAKLYAAVSAPVATTRDALLKRLGGIREVVTGAYNRIRGHQPQKTLKGIVEEVAYDGVEDVKRERNRRMRPWKMFEACLMRAMQNITTSW